MRKFNILNLTDTEVDSKVRIQGTQYDRKRKLTDKQLKKARKLYNKNKSINYIADKMDVHPNTIRYNVDPVYRAKVLSYAATRGCKTRIISDECKINRIAYKRELILKGKVTI